MLPISVVIIAQDEEDNIAQCLATVLGWAERVLVVDGGSSDGTTAIASELGATIMHRRFDHWANQRNWALEQFLPSDPPWVLFLDADEEVTYEFKEEVENLLFGGADELAGVYVRFAFWFLGHELHYGYESPPVMRLVRRGYVTWCHKGAREYCTIRGATSVIKAKVTHNDRKGLSCWIQKQNRNATREAKQIAAVQSKSLTYDSRTERAVRIWLRQTVYDRLPRLLRPIPYFFYRYVLRLGFLDGISGFAYCFLQGFWYPLLIDLKVIEIERQQELDKPL